MDTIMLSKNLAIKAVRKALADEGYGYNGLTMTEVAEEVKYPDGSYNNDHLRVSVDGKMRQYSLALALRTPKVAAVEIARDFGLKRSL